MPQLQKGTTYTGTGVSAFVTHTNLNAHVDNAKLLGGAIDEQVSNSVSTDQDLLLVNKGGDLFKQTKGQFTKTINSETISTNQLSVQDASTDLVDTDVIEMTGTVSESYIDLNNASIFSSNTTRYNIDFGFGVGTAFPAPAGWVNSTTYNFFGGQTNFKKGVNVGENEGHDILVEGDVTVTGNILSNGKPVMTGTAVAMKSGQCGVFGSTILHKTGELDIPADETWIITFLCHFTAPQTGNTRPDGYYTVTASVEKDTYSDVTIGSWTKVFPSYGALGFINVAIKLTRGDLANMSKRLKFTSNVGINGSTSSYSILLSKVKTEAFNLDSSIL